MNVTAVPLLMLVAEIFELFVRAAAALTVRVKVLITTVSLLSLTLIWTVYLPVEAGVQVWVVAVL